MGFPEGLCIEAYLACDKNENLAVNYILSRMDELAVSFLLATIFTDWSEIKFVKMSNNTTKYRNIEHNPKPRNMLNEVNGPLS